MYVYSQLFFNELIIQVKSGLSEDLLEIDWLKLDVLSES